MSSQSRDVAEQEAKTFLQIIEDSSNYQFGYNHSTGYSMIGYMCGMLRYYYPVEFIAAYLNNANNDDDIIYGTTLAKEKNVQIRPIKFRYSKAGYQPDRENRAVYKGIASVKYLSTEIADALYSLRDMYFESFVDFLKVNPCDIRQTEILIKLDFFSEFGQSQRLLHVLHIYDQYGQRKQLQIANCPLPEEQMLKVSTKTKSLYKIFDSIELIKMLCDTQPDQPISIKERIQAETEFLGYIEYTDPAAQNVFCVMDINTKFSPVLTCYHLADGITYKYKINKQTYQRSPLEAGDVIIVYLNERKHKMRKNTNNQWEVVPDAFDIWLTAYKKV